MLTTPFPAVESHANLDDLRWAAVMGPDASADGLFWSCVRTTGVYCRPSCAGRPKRENVSFMDTRIEAEAAGFRPCKRCRPERYITGDLGERIEAVDWRAATKALNTEGWAMLGRLLDDEECAQLIAGYDEDAQFRSRVIMRRHGFGEGEYRYYTDGAPDIIAILRERLYGKLAPLANEWRIGLKQDSVAYPADFSTFRNQCGKAGQHKPTPLILKYGPGDYNRLHQDLYGSKAFPIQVAILLCQPGRDFEGGEFVMTEQAPRRQSRAIVAPLEKGSAIAFAVNTRPVLGARGAYRVTMRHGVSAVRSGMRYCLGVIFHDAA